MRSSVRTSATGRNGESPRHDGRWVTGGFPDLPRIWYPVGGGATLSVVELEIIEAARSGDPSAFNALVEEFTPTVLAAAHGWCGDRHLAADIAQDVFATAFVKIEQLREPAAIAGWLMAITRSVARRSAVRAHPSAMVAEGGIAPVDDVVIAAEEARRVREAVDALPAQLRVPIVLHYFAGRPLAEIAELCDVPLSTVKKRMRDARARIRGGGLEVTQRSDDPLFVDDPGGGPGAIDAIRVFSALRTRSPSLLAALLDARPDLVDVRENWSAAAARRHGLLPTNGGTPLLRAVERGDHPMIRLLLDRGADPDGACTCSGAENPIWVAAVQGDAVTVDLLLSRGADPNHPAFAGLTPLDVAVIRGHDQVAQRLLMAGARRSTLIRDAHAPTPEDFGTGIKAIDLWCPLPTAGLVHVHFSYGAGVMVLLCELSRRWTAAGRCVRWIGFVPRPLDLGDVHHVVAEGGLEQDIAAGLTDHTIAERRRRRSFDAAMAASAEDDTLVIFTESGFRDAVDERLFELAGRNSLTLVVSPIDEPQPPRFGTAPFLAAIRFDRERAERGRWPAISADSWSTVGPPALVELAALARNEMNDDLDRYLCQPFYIAEHVTARPGESISLAELTVEVAKRLSSERLSAS